MYRGSSKYQLFFRFRPRSDQSNSKPTEQVDSDSVPEVESLTASSPTEATFCVDHALPKILPTSASKNDSTGVLGFGADEVWQHYYLHLSRLAAIRTSIRDLTLRHRRSVKLAYEYTISPLGWRPHLTRNDKINAVGINLINASHTFRARSKQQCEERGTVVLLQRCVQKLKIGPDPMTVGWRPVPGNGRRWKEGRRGWIGLSADAEEAEGGDDERI